MEKTSKQKPIKVTEWSETKSYVTNEELISVMFSMTAPIKQEKDIASIPSRSNSIETLLKEPVEKRIF